MKTILQTPIGTLCAEFSGSALCALAPSLQASEPNESQASGDREAVLRLRRELFEYFAGERRAFSIETAPRGTDFERRVWRALSQIPYGAVRTYGEIAAALGMPHAARAVGNAVGKNPILILIPCHRVIAAGGHIGGFSAGLPAKRTLHGIEHIVTIP